MKLCQKSMKNPSFDQLFGADAQIAILAAPRVEPGDQ
jgi:hypothetical protein